MKADLKSQIVQRAGFVNWFLEKYWLYVAELQSFGSSDSLEGQMYLKIKLQELPEFNSVLSFSHSTGS